MTVNFATPIAHQTNPNYSAFANAVVIGRPFRQPLITAPAAGGFAAGLELFLSSAGDVPLLFAWLDSTVTFVPATATAPGDRLVLTVDPRVLTSPGTTTTLGSVTMLERKPKKLTFENVDRVAVQTALESVLNDAYVRSHMPFAIPSSWHPSMRMMVTALPAGPVTLRAYLDGHAPAPATVTTLITDMLSGAPTILSQLPVWAGEAVGRASAYLATDPLPAAPPFPLGGPSDANRARRVTLVTEDTSGDVLDPTYYLHVLMRRMLLPPANRIVNTLTNTVVGGNLVHPLVTVLPALAASPVPFARAQVNGAFRWSIGNILGTWHGYPFPPTARVSQAEWQYTATGTFEARIAASGTPIPLSPTAAHTNKVTSYWTTYSHVTNLIAIRLQVPVELIVALACNESLPNLSARSIRLEPLLQKQRTKLAASAHAALELDYDHVVGASGTVNSAVNNPNDSTQLSVTLAAARRFSANSLKARQLRLLVGDSDRLEITANNGSAAAVTNYDVTVKDRNYEGGSLAAGTQGAAITRFYSLATRGVGNAIELPVRTVLHRAGVLRRLRVQVAVNTLPAGSAFTVVLNGAATALTCSLGLGVTAAADNANSVIASPGDTISVQVTTPAGGPGLLVSNIRCSVQYAPATAGTVYILEGFSPPAPGVPNPWNGAAPVRAGRTLTWDQLTQVMDAIDGDRVSPGLLQTLISTAIGVNAYLSRLDPGIFAAVGVPAAPATPGAYLNDWLLTGDRSILLGAGYLRQLLHTQNTRFDLPVLGSAYNRGNVNTTAGRRWGFSPDPGWDYPDHIALFFNAAVGFFDGAAPPAVAPAVRFMR
jgi:hypothetical protein